MVCPISSSLGTFMPMIPMGSRLTDRSTQARTTSRSSGSADDFSVSCGISLTFDFGIEVQNAWDAYRSYQRAGIVVEEPNIENGTWRIMARVDLLDCPNFDQAVGKLEEIAKAFGGKQLLPDHARGLDARSVEEGLVQLECMAASTAYRMGRYQQAIDLWRSLIDRDCIEQSVGWYWIGRAYLNARLGSDAEAAFLVMELGAKGDTALARIGKMGRAWSILEQDETLRAEMIFLEMVETAWQPVAQFGLGCCRAREGEFGVAMGWLRMAFRQAPHLKYDAGREVTLEEMRSIPEFAIQMELSWWDRLWSRARTKSKWRGYEDFVDQLELVELY